MTSREALLQSTDEQQLKELLKEWGKFPAYDEADFNCLFNEVRTALDEGLNANEVYLVIQNEFMNHFGEEGPSDDVAQIAVSVSGWWHNREGVREGYV